MPPHYNNGMAETQAVPNDKVLMQLESFNVRYSRKINISFQSWEFSHGQTLSFEPSNSADERRALIRKVSEFVRIAVLQDIVATLPEIEHTIGDQPHTLEALKRSLGLV